MNENSGLGWPLYPTLHKSHYWPYLSNLNRLQPASHPAKESTESWQIRQAENKGRLECRKRRHSLITFIVWKPHHRCLLQTSLLRSRVCYFCPFHSILFKGYTFFTTPLYGVFFGVCITLCHNESSAIYLQMTGQTLAEYPAQFLLCYNTTLKEFVFFFFSSRSICIFIATTLHYFQLVVAFWLNVMFLDVGKAFIKTATTDSERKRMLFCFGSRQEKKTTLSESKPLQVQGETDLKVNLLVDVKKRTFKMYSVYAWGCPLVIVAASHVADQVLSLTQFFSVSFLRPRKWPFSNTTQSRFPLIALCNVSSRWVEAEGPSKAKRRKLLPKGMQEQYSQRWVIDLPFNDLFT